MTSPPPSTDELQKEVERLRATNRILEEENLQLSERAEDAMLLALVAEALEGVSETRQVIARVLERISILKDIPYVTCGSIRDTELQCISSYASFSERDDVGYPLSLDQEILTELRHGPYLTEKGVGISATFADQVFMSQAILLVPFSCYQYGSGVFLFFDREYGRSRLGAMLFLLEQVVRLTVSRIDNIFLDKQLELLNQRLEERVRQKTRDLQASNDRLRQTYDRFVSILDGVDSYITVIDTRTHTVLFGNKAARELFGADLEGRTCYQVLRGYGEPCPFCKIPQLLAAKEGARVITWESFNPRLNIWILHNEHILDWPDVPQALLSVGTEITMLKQAEKEKGLLADKLHQAQKMEAIGVLAGSVAHDLNNILTGIVSYPELLLATAELEPGTAKALETIQGAGRKAARIVQDLLMLARRGIQENEPVELGTLVKEYLAGLECRELQRRHPEVTLNGPQTEEQMYVLGSPVHLGNVLTNLVNNGAEAIAGSGVVTISLTRLELSEQPMAFQAWRAGPYGRLSVADSGTGIPEHMVEKIFDPFFSLKEKGRSGTGLGLAVVWGTVHDHHGYIEVDSREGSGTTVHVYLPLTDVSPMKSAARKKMEPVCGAGEKVLVVDDDPEQRRIATEIVAHLGYTVLSAASGEEAIRFLEKMDVKVVLLDMLMGEGMDGLETYREIRALRPSPKTIIVSGFSQSERVHEALELGVVRYLQKPYTMGDLSGALAAALQDDPVENRS